MVLTSKWGRILQEMHCQCQIWLICPFAGRKPANFHKRNYLLSANTTDFEKTTIQAHSAMSDLPTTSQSSDLREVIVSKKRRANDSRKVTRIFLTAEIYSKFQVSRLDLMKKSKHENPKHENAEDGFNHAASHTSHQMFTTNNGGHLFEQATVTINITK